jgi:hypothetical protein
LATKPTLTKKQTVLTLTVGVVLGLLVTVVMTTLDWRLNPSGIFHNAHGTDWKMVRETAFSWFLPVALVASVVGAIVLFLFPRPK